jgi:peptidoglycan/xylan/chitin deacetylase (PgdA/CDA1 family)
MIVLLHDSLPQTAAMLPELISSLQQKGITFTTAEELKNWHS